MGDLTCDDCEDSVHVVPTDSTQFDAELACGCSNKETVGFVFLDDGPRNGEPSDWGLDRTGENYVEFSSGKTPVMRTHVNGPTTMTGYHLSTDDGFGPHFEFRQVPHEAWRDDHDPDKWSEDDWQSIVDSLDEHGELDRNEIADETGLPRRAVVGLINEHLNRQSGVGDEVCHTTRGHYVTREDWWEMRL